MTNAYKPLPKDKLAEALEDADMRVLLMTVFHLTGDRKWLAPPYSPARAVELIAPEDAGLPEAVQAEIKAAALELLSNPITPAIEDPGDELMVEMMNVCLGEDVPPEYAPMMREEMGLISRQVRWSGGAKAEANSLPVVIIGAGASGMALGANLKALGLPFVILERNADVGGTWYENFYPGCSVDTPNHAYSFSFGSRYPWSRYFSARDELFDYMRKTADEQGLRENIRLNTQMTSAAWDESKSLWRIQYEDAAGVAQEMEARALVSAIGQLSLPSVPDIKGAADFDGPIFHSALWPKDLEWRGKRIAIIGTGATSMQVTPAIVDDVAQLDVYQRSAQWARPIARFHEPIPEGAQWLLAEAPFYGSWHRFTMLWRYGDGLLPTLRIDPKWPHPERSLNRANDRHRVQMTEHLTEKLAGRPDLIEKCLPTYPPYGKRILLDYGWYDALVKPNLELVTDDIDHIAADGVVAADGTHRSADIIVLATGFDLGKMAARLNLTGVGGVNLLDQWADDDPKALYGVTTPNFPNLFVMQGPNSGLGHGGSAIFTGECQARYIASCLVGMAEQGLSAMDLKPEVQEAYVARVDAEHQQMVWSHPGMSTYYRNAKGRVYSVMPWRLVDYWGMTHEADFSDYRVKAAAQD